MKLPHIFSPGSSRSIRGQFLCFSGVGVIGTCAHYLTLMGLVEVVSANAVVASALGFTVGALVNYYLNYHITFKSKKSHNEAIIKFLTVALIGLALNTLIMFVAAEILLIYYLLAQVMATGMVLVWNFAGNRLWTFREGNHAA